MSPVRLTGELICATSEQASLVSEHLPRHVILTRAEPGCLSFEVAPTDDPFVWSVREMFEDDASFESHQQRAADSDWGRMTTGIDRSYQIDRD